MNSPMENASTSAINWEFDLESKAEPLRLALKLKKTKLLTPEEELNKTEELESLGSRYRWYYSFTSIIPTLYTVF